MASSGKVQAANYCRILIKTEATWNSGDKIDGTWGEQPWIYAVGGFDGTKFSGEYIHIFPNIPDRPKTTKIEVTANKDEKGEIKSANFIFYHDTVELNGKTPRGLDDVATIKGSNVPRRPDKEAPGIMCFEVTGEAVGACLDPSSSWRTAAFNKNASCCWTTKFTPNKNSFIKIELSQTPRKQSDRLTAYHLAPAIFMSLIVISAQAKGLGLGLVVCKNMLNLMAAKYGESKPGKGSSFLFTIPL